MHSAFPQPADEPEADSTPPEPLAAVLRRAFAQWAGPPCERCGLPAVLHGERCDDAKAGR